MSLQLEVLEFLNENANRAFPFVSAASRTSADGLFTIPNDFIVDMLCSVDSDITRVFFVSRIDTNPYSTVVTVSTEASEIGTFTITADSPANAVFFLVPTNAFTGANGKLVTGVASRASVLTLPQGTFQFTQAATQLEARCFVPSVAGINRIAFENTDGDISSFTGTVVIRAGVNVGYQNLDDDTIRINAAEGLGLNAPCEVVSPILTINGEAPNSAGEFTLIGNGIDLVEIPNGMRLENQCTEPCAGCDEIGELLQRVMTVESNLIELKNSYTQLRDEYSVLKEALACACSV